MCIHSYFGVAPIGKTCSISVLRTIVTKLPFERLSRGNVHLPQNVRVDAHRGRNCTMSRPLLYNLRMNLGSQQDRSVSMTGIVEPHVRETCLEWNHKGIEQRRLTLQVKLQNPQNIYAKLHQPLVRFGFRFPSALALPTAFSPTQN